MKRSCHKKIHMKYESCILNGLKVIVEVKVFVHGANADVDANADAMFKTFAPWTFGSLKSKSSPPKSSVMQNEMQIGRVQ